MKISLIFYEKARESGTESVGIIPMQQMQGVREHLETRARDRSCHMCALPVKGIGTAQLAVVAHRIVTADSDSDTVIILATGGEGTYVQWTLTGSAVRE